MIVNKASNSGRSLDIIHAHLPLIKEILEKVEIYPVEKHESISDVVRSKAQHFDVIVACGGDGTIRKAAIGIRDQDALLGLLPLGSGNDFAKMLGLKKSFERNLTILKQAQVITCDIVQVNNTQFINTLGIGFDGYTNYLSSKSAIKGSFKYVIAGLRALLTANLFNATITINNVSEKFESMMLIVANGKWEGGKYLVSPESLINDGELELIILNKISKAALAYEFIRLSIGRPLSTDLITLKRCSKAEIHLSKRVYVHADGEVEPRESTFQLSIIPNSFNVIHSMI